MRCEYKDEKGKLNAIMCGKGGNFCSSDRWCTNPSNVKHSYWTSNSYPQNFTCNSYGKSISYI